MEGCVISWVHRPQRKRKQDALDDYKDETATFEKMLRLEN